MQTLLVVVITALVSSALTYCWTLQFVKSGRTGPFTGIAASVGISQPPLTQTRGSGREQAQRCPPILGHSKCRWQFRRYIPSELETKWWAVVDQVGKNPCPATNSTAFRDYFQIYFDEIARNKMVPDQVEPYGGCSCEKNREPALFDPKVFSRFEYVNTCTDDVRHSFIEPLAGILRHPGTCPPPSKSSKAGRHWRSKMIRKDWLVVDQWSLHRNGVSDQRFFYFDAGASTWKAGSGGASQAWFDAVWANKCAPFDGYWMWEVTAHEASTVFQDVPGQVKPHYRWFNIPAAVKHNDSDSPLYHIMQAARKEDYVMFKLDIDNNGVEEGLVKEMMAHPEIMELIDEFFWEHHINMYPMSLPWAKTISKHATQRESITFFRTLREHGIRAHSWV